MSSSCDLVSRYDNLMELGRQRRQKLEESCKAYQLVREAGELAQWINDKETVALSEEVGGDLEQVEVIQRKFDDFQKVRQPNLSSSTLKHMAHRSVQGFESLEKPWIWLDQIQGLEILEFCKVVLNLIVVNKILFWLGCCDK